MPKPLTKRRTYQDNGKASTSPQVPGRNSRLPREDTRAEVNELARDSNLIERIQRDIAALGLVGEENNGLLTYIVYSSRKQTGPPSIIIKGPSSSGKDKVQRVPARLIPDDDVYDLMSITPQALYYGEDGWLKNKIMLGGERSHDDNPMQRDKTAAIRQMLSHGYITKATVEEGKAKYIRQDGPIVYSETTTKNSIFKEDANRCFQIETDDSDQLTQRVKAEIAARYKGESATTAEDLEEIIEQHHEFQNSLEPVRVRIPYADALEKFTPDKIEMRRFLEKIFAVIEAVVVLHQHQRTSNKHDWLVATLEDYAVVRPLLLEPMHTALGLGKKYKRYEGIIGELPRGTFTTTAAEEKFPNRMACHRALGALEKAGLLKCLQKGTSHKSARWRWTGTSIGELVLPSVERLRNCVTTAK
ncbi:hypothetical protein LCGC14_1298370 [marine sediment metagenome]|uniref:Uncharacterized protein n=1 Tax=marine sediment metagenome TaxID=412755 RepID=A0A0F9KRY9_9ZZZZ